jgi:hypothetical protein
MIPFSAEAVSVSIADSVAVLIVVLLAVSAADAVAVDVDGMEVTVSVNASYESSSFSSVSKGEDFLSSSSSPSLSKGAVFLPSTSCCGDGLVSQLFPPGALVGLKSAPVVPVACGLAPTFPNPPVFSLLPKEPVRHCVLLACWPTPLCSLKADSGSELTIRWKIWDFQSRI